MSQSQSQPARCLLDAAQRYVELGYAIFPCR
jgi:hypothetical protein